MISRRWVLGAMLAGSATAAGAAPLARSIRPMPRPGDYRKRAIKAAEALIAKARLSGSAAYAVADARTGMMLETREAEKGLPPASVTKAITALYALETLGAGHRFETRLLATGPVTAGRVQGDIILAGGGDPTLNTDQLGDMAARLRAAGVTGATGRFLYYSGALPELKVIDPTQPDHVGYNPAVSGLNLNFNRVHFEWRRASSGYTITMDARAERFRPKVSVAKMRVVARDLPVYTYSDKGGADHWTVASRALGKGGARWLPVRKPGLYAAEVFRTLARAQGITLGKPGQTDRLTGGSVMVSHQSVPLREILRAMLKYSTNLTAEVVGLAATRVRGKTPASLAASGREMSLWAAQRLGARSAAFKDHSGLGTGSRITAQDMVRALVAVGPNGPLKGILKDIYFRDANGRALKSHAVKIKAKTGTLNFVSALAGYVTAEDGTELAFAVFTADTAKRSRLKRSDRERPEGGRSWTKRARQLQLDLIGRWAVLYGS